MEKSVYERYCKIRDRFNYKDADVAKGANITKSTFSDWKAGRYVPKQEKLQKIADFLGISVEYFQTGEEKTEPKLTIRDTKEINSMIDQMEQLLKQDGLMFDGDPASPEAIESILSAMQIGMEMAKKKNKEKYTPKKYKKD